MFMLLLDYCDVPPVMAPTIAKCVKQHTGAWVSRPQAAWSVLRCVDVPRLWQHGANYACAFPPAMAHAYQV